MPSRASFVGVLLAAFVPLCFGGCGSKVDAVKDPVAAKETSVLTELGEVYRSYVLTKNKPPKSASDLTVTQALGPNAVAAVTAGDVIVEWGAVLPDTNEEPGKSSSPEVLAYFKEAPTAGGVVLMLDRTTRKMTAEEFKAAPKAGAKPAP